MKFTLETKLGTLLDNPQAEAIIEKYMPGVSTNPMIGMAKGMSLNMLLATPQAAQFGITKEKVESVLAEINKVVK
ncbi:MAG TPA: hypothetical protein VK856_00740 [Anaerolineaceae bacterium]|nr:hypothetical protein [Anaerolineaceae bacterium]